MHAVPLHRYYDALFRKSIGSIDAHCADRQYQAASINAAPRSSSVVRPEARARLQHDDWLLMSEGNVSEHARLPNIDTRQQRSITDWLHTWSPSASNNRAQINEHFIISLLRCLGRRYNRPPGAEAVPHKQIIVGIEPSLMILNAINNPLESLALPRRIVASQTPTLEA